MRNQLVVVAGNIGSGKTTLAKRVANKLNCHVELELVDDNPYLGDFYADMGRWSLHLQFHFLVHRAGQHKRASHSGKPAILDRSIYEDACVFAAALHGLGYMSDRDFATYDKIFDMLASQLQFPKLILYLHAPVHILLERIIPTLTMSDRRVPSRGGQWT
jgi:deoxyadenosine/deoxycytidine kinase